MKSFAVCPKRKVDSSNFTYWKLFSCRNLFRFAYPRIIRVCALMAVAAFWSSIGKERGFNISIQLKDSLLKTLFSMQTKKWIMSGTVATVWFLTDFLVQSKTFLLFFNGVKNNTTPKKTIFWTPLRFQPRLGEWQ